MPKALEEALFREGHAQGLKGDRLNAFVYGTMRKTGWRSKRERTLGEAYHNSKVKRMSR